MTKMRILVCEDDEPIAEILKIILEENGYEVLVLFSGKAIYKRIREYKPSLILLDILMPGVDGQEITKVLKRDRATKKIPIIVISAVSELKKIAGKIGADDFIYKPFEIETVLKTIAKYVS